MDAQYLDRKRHDKIYPPAGDSLSIWSNGVELLREVVSADDWSNDRTDYFAVGPNKESFWHPCDAIASCRCTLQIGAGGIGNIKFI